MRGADRQRGRLLALGSEPDRVGVRFGRDVPAQSDYRAILARRRTMYWVLPVLNFTSTFAQAGIELHAHPLRVRETAAYEPVGEDADLFRATCYREASVEFDAQSVDRALAQRLVRARVDPREPAVELVLEVERVREHATRLVVGLRIALQALDRALALRIAALAEPPPDHQLPEKSGERIRRAPAMVVDPGLP